MSSAPAIPMTRIGRVIVIVAMSTTCAVAMGWVCVDSWQEIRRTPAPSLDLLLAAATASGVCIVLAWCALVVVIVALTAVPGRLGMIALTVGSAVAPSGAQRLARLALGVVATTAQLGVVVLPGTAAPVSGAPLAVAAPEPAPSVMAASGHAAADTLPPIGRPPVAPPTLVVPAPQGEPASPTPSAPPEVQPPRDALNLAGKPDRLRDDDARPSDQRRSVTVEPGDTLWSIAADHLDDQPSSRAISQAWPLWFAANREVIGPDPDVIRPGMVLVEPAPPPSTPTRSDQ